MAAEAVVGTDGRPVECLDIRTGLSFEYRAQHLLSSGVIDEGWMPDTAQCCLGSPEGVREHVVPDGAGGAFAAWVDSRLEEPDIYLQHFTACGEPVEGWPSGGKAVCAAQYSQYNLDVCADGEGGVFLAWQDFRDGHSSTVYLQRIAANGSPVEGWPVAGMIPAPGRREQAAPHVTPDGSGGALVFWQERDGTGLALRVQHITGVGSVAFGWPQGGVTLVPGSARVTGVCAREDASGHLTVVWRSSGPSGETLQLAGLEVETVPGTEWAASASTLSSAGMFNEPAVTVASDGGLLVGWSENIAGQASVKLVRLAPGGSFSSGWPTTG